MPRERMDLERAAMLRRRGFTWRYIHINLRRKSGQVFDYDGMKRATIKHMRRTNMETEPTQPVTIDDDDILFLVDQEDSTEKYYERTEEHWDWPEGSSGPTCGVGYDCGYVTIQECQADWKGIVDDATIRQLVRGVGFKGDSAHYFVQRNRDAITITWDQALQEFRQREVPKWIKRIDQAVQHYDHLSSHSAAALLSLCYNRGLGGFTSNLNRFREMRAVKSCMATGDWKDIPMFIRNMKRIWPEGSDLYKRRIAEGDLFEKGVPQCRSLISPSSTSISGSEPSATPPPPSPSEPSV